MAVSRVCAVGATLLAHASATTFEWDRYMQEYAGGYYKEKMDGEFSNYMQKYTRDYPEAGDHADRYSQDRLSQAKKYQDQYAGPHASMMGQTALLAEAPASGQEAVNHTAVALAAESAAQQDGEAMVEELRTWDAKLKKDLADKNFSQTVAQGIVAKVESAHESQQAELERRFCSAVEALEDPEAVANASKAKAAEHAAKDSMKDLERLHHEKEKEMRSTLEGIRKAGERKARMLWKEARKAAHRVQHSGMAASRAERRAGAEERIYEQKQLDTEETSERLLGDAEKYAEGAEDHAEEQSDKVKCRMEILIEGLRAKVREARKAREERYHQAKARLHEARKAAEEKAKNTAEASPTAFLAGGGPSRLGSALVAPLAFAAMLAAASTTLVLRFCNAAAVMDRPLLG